MKILLIDVNYGMGSTGSIVKNLQQEFELKGHEVLVLYGRGPKVKKNNVIKITNIFEVWFHAFLGRAIGIFGSFSPFATFKAKNIINKFGPDVVNIHDMHGYFINDISVLKHLQKNNIPIVMTLHSDYFFTGRCGVSGDCDRWKEACGNCPQLNTYPVSWWFDFSNFMHKRKKNNIQKIKNLSIICPSTWLYYRVNKSSIYSNIKSSISIVPNPISNNWFENNKKNIRYSKNINNKSKILVVGANLMTEHKGGSWIMQLSERIIDLDVEIICIGASSPDSGILTKNIKFLGNVFDPSLLRNSYDEAICTVITSKSETFSMVAAESIIRGTPVIGFNTGAIKETALGLGEFTNYGDINGLVSLVRQLKCGEIRYPLNFIKEVNTKARERYLPKNVAKSYLDIFTKVV